MLALRDETVPADSHYRGAADTRHRRGSQRKKRTATTSPTSPQAATTARSPNSNPAPVVWGFQAVNIASKKWRIGKASAKLRTPLGSSSWGMKTPDRK